MTQDDPKGPPESGFKDIEAGLGTLLSALGDAVAEVTQRLGDGQTGEFHRSIDIETAQGPMRAEAGVRVRFADQVGAASRTDPEEPGPQDAEAAAAGHRERVDLCLAAEGWVWMHRRCPRSGKDDRCWVPSVPGSTRDLWQPSERSRVMPGTHRMRRGHRHTAVAVVRMGTEEWNISPAASAASSAAISRRSSAITPGYSSRM